MIWWGIVCCGWAALILAMVLICFSPTFPLLAQFSLGLAGLSIVLFCAGGLMALNQPVGNWKRTP